MDHTGNHHMVSMAYHNLVVVTVDYIYLPYRDSYRSCSDRDSHRHLHSALHNLG